MERHPRRPHSIGVPHIIRIPIARWWRLIQPPVPQRVSIRREDDSGRDRALFFIEGRPSGYIAPFAAGQWLHTIFHELRAILTTTEELAIQRALLLQALFDADPSAARRAAADFGMAVDATDVFYGVGDSAEIFLWHMVDDEEPPDLGWR